MTDLSKELSIREWAQNPTPDSARSLIRHYHESEWRSSRVQVIKALGSFQDSRSFQFLVEIISSNQDLALQELALFSLANRKSRSSKLFLKKFYLRCPDTLRPKTAFALGLAQASEMSSKLLSDFDQAYAKQDLVWLKNLVLALGELKEFAALPRLRRLLEQQNTNESSSDLSIAALFSLARLERDQDSLQLFEARFFDDSLLYQVLQNTRAMILIRSQFKLEDYLSKIFNSKNPHPILPLELRAFQASEVEIGLSIFSIETQWRELLFATSGLPAKNRHDLIYQIYKKSTDLNLFFEVLATVNLSDSEALAQRIEGDTPSLKTDFHLRFFFVQAFAEVLNLDAEAKLFFIQKDDSLSIRFINLWSEMAAVEEKSVLSKRLKNFEFDHSLSDSVFARLLRAFAELGVENKAVTDSWALLFKRPALRSSLFLYAEKFIIVESLKGIESLAKSDLESLGQRVLATLEALTTSNTFDQNSTVLEKVLSEFKDHFNSELKVGVLRCLRNRPIPKFEAWVISQLKHQDALMQLNAVIALKAYRNSREAGDALALVLEASGSVILRGRILDTLCFHQTLVAKRAVIQYLKTNIRDDEVIDKIYRSFDPDKKGGEEFVKDLSNILIANPDHSSWEKLLALRERLASAGSQGKASEDGAQTSPELELLDERLVAAIPKFKALDGAIKVALRAAEQPFMQGVGTENLPIDKAPTVLEYCKALDLILEKHLGQKYLFPKLDRELHDFQTLWHRVGFGEEYPEIQKVLGLLGLKGKITPEHFPLHKARMMCGTFFNGKIIQDRFKIFDGLRAWAVIFIFFTRKMNLSTGTIGPLLKFPNSTDEKAIAIAKKLMQLQDLRNPAAHRQTYTDLASVKTVRNESVELINTILDLVL